MNAEDILVTGVRQMDSAWTPVPTEGHTEQGGLSLSWNREWDIDIKVGEYLRTLTGMQIEL